MSIPLTQATAPVLLIPRRLPWGLGGLLLLALVGVPLVGNDYWLNAILIPFL
ncbi:branched-chain amino acid ABC transporter permease, partial [Pseudomonas chlororaphis]|nr:branched-chain amino acid ABC transporter permease [Pseudomonas chlororaphis]